MLIGTRIVVDIKVHQHGFITIQSHENLVKQGIPHPG